MSGLAIADSSEQPISSGGFRIINGVPVASMSSPREDENMGDYDNIGTGGNVPHRVAAEIIVSQSNGAGPREIAGRHHWRIKLLFPLLINLIKPSARKDRGLR